MILPDSLPPNLSREDSEFFRRVFRGDLARYRKRLQAIGFTGFDTVLDAGMGFGQWALSLAQLNVVAHGIDTANNRVQLVRTLAELNGIANLHLTCCGVETVDFPDAYFDAVFCYSVLYHTDVAKTLSNLSRTLKPGGSFYVNFNGLGWYAHLLLNRGLGHASGRSLWMALRGIFGTMRQHPGGPRALSRRRVLRLASAHGLRAKAMGGDGTVRVQPVDAPAFYQGRYFGMPGVIEILFTKE